jgi:ElaB/YqjD/DUF883 family membrane-anchored ribosome-binding protein
MVDIAQSRYPSDMVRAAESPDDQNLLESTMHDVVDSLNRYVRDQPVSALLWAFGIGFLLGWRLKPW